jgi:hypothetical protein
MKLVFCGDTHGKWERAEPRIRSVMDRESFTNEDRVIQVGDFGVWRWSVGTDLPIDFIDGNHEDFPLLRSSEWKTAHPNATYRERGELLTLPCGTVIGFIGGADSIHKGGTEWFADEAITMGDVYRVLEAWSEKRPDIVVAHDGPTSAYPWLTGRHKGEHGNSPDMLQMIWEEIRPAMWFHGHHHSYFDVTNDGTRFIGLDRLCYTSGNEAAIVENGTFCLDL